ncbi:Flp family type IVb pilin [Roseobacter ponti]|uniref:Flp family type IVb pilin n=2 Tax=Roseobacter ponti TaxID=1891787 RepID=A0A858SY76_9RHOB|nr:Flp family type IVb pilin [Roseobacter ponti]
MFLSTWVRLRHSDEGATLVEYGIAVTLAVAVGVTALGLLGTAIIGELNEAEALM